MPFTSAPFAPSALRRKESRFYANDLQYKQGFVFFVNVQLLNYDMLTLGEKGL